MLIRPFQTEDFFRFNKVNFDPFTETYSLSFYNYYFSRWPDFSWTCLSDSGEIMGYLIGKIEGDDELYHGHVSAVTVAPEYRRLGVASKLMKYIENATEKNKGYFVDLFVKTSNVQAIDFYKKLGYVVYRKVLNYYNDTKEDAFDMRKSTCHDSTQERMKPLGRDILPSELEWD
eukprot:TRINITY_DN3653_c0_g1_i1.p1 TRINITY_DN3653_c0_g1~~TRINITY_DN3653_c0_g1_i1.p1  ORF type:complete len:174 (+),score=44.44 TRINITY_DN3653_c0_g1_i1:31-552(+)